MAWSVPKIGAVATVASGNITLAEPAGIAAGDLMIACIGYRSNAAFTVPGDWNLVATQQSSGDTDATNGIASGVMMWCVRGGSAPTLTFNRTAGDVAQGRIIAYTGGHATTPYDTGSAATSATTVVGCSTASINTAQAGELLVAMTSLGDTLTTSAFDAVTDPATASGATDTTNAPTAGTWRERADTTTGTGADHGLAIADAIRATAGATGTISAVGSGTGRHVMIVGAFKLAAAGGSTTMTADAGSVGLTGTAATLREAKVLVASSASVTQTGTAASLRFGHKLTATIRTYNLTGLLSSLGQSTVMFGAAGSVAATGISAGLRHHQRLSAEPALVPPAGFTGEATSSTEITLEWRQPETLNIDGSATLTRGRYMTASDTSIVITGTSATLTQTPPTMPAGFALSTPRNLMGTPVGTTVNLSWEAGYSITVTGLDTNFTRTRNLTAIIQSVTLSGTSATLANHQRLAADAGAFLATGISATFDRLATAAPGTVGLTGASASLIYSPAGSQTIAANTGTFTSTGLAATFRVQRGMSASSTGINVDGMSAGLTRRATLSAGVGAVTIGTGLSVTLSSSVKLLAATAGVFNIQGISATFSSIPDVVPLVPPLTIDLDSGASTMVLISGESSVHLES